MHFGFSGVSSAPSQPLTGIDRITRINQTFSSVTVVWDRPDVNVDHISSYVISVNPSIPLPANGVIKSTDSHFNDREITLILRHGVRYAVSVRADNCNDTQQGNSSAILYIHLQGNYHTLV